MLLAIDIGNTTIHNGIFRRNTLIKDFRIPTYSDDLEAWYAKRLRPRINDIDSIIVASVVPLALARVKKLFRKIFNMGVIIVGVDISSGVHNLYDNPMQVGQDRLVNARAAYELYGRNCIIADFGTAITIDVINNKKEYLGGVISAGPELSLWALSEKTALLPKVTIRRPAGILGRKTQDSMIIGAVYGFSSMCDGIVYKLKKRYCHHATVIATGGLSALIGPYCETVNKIDPNLTLKGLRLIMQDYRHV